MTALPSATTMYNALLNRDTSFEGIFYVAVKTTGIFCRPSCPARKPLPENVNFYGSVKEALLAGYQPCKRCRPLEPAGNKPEWLASLFEKIEENPFAKWSDYELREENLAPNRVRRWFKSNYGMTFHSYLRVLRLGKALGKIKEGENMVQTALDHGYNSLSGFRDAIKKITGLPAAKSKDAKIVYIDRISTPLGILIAGAVDEGICLLEFMDRRMLATQIKVLARRLNCNFVHGSNEHITKLTNEIRDYFGGKLKRFTTPIIYPGTEFQEEVWNKLLEIPYGKTICYEDLAKGVGIPTAMRAVANANGCNRIAIIIPCHRVIGKSGELRGYGGGLWRKKYLIELEKRNSN